MRRLPVPAATEIAERERCNECGRVLPYWTRARIVAAFQRWAEEYGFPPKASNWSPRSTPWHPTLQMVRLVFGGWNAALIASGFAPRSVRGRWTKAEILAAILHWTYEHGHPPTVEEWREAAANRPAVHTVQARFGSWNRAIALAGYETRVGAAGRTTATKVAA